MRGEARRGEDDGATRPRARATASSDDADERVDADERARTSPNAPNAR